jgi:hypothetical protein
MYHTCPVGTFFDYVSRGCTYRGVSRDCNNPMAVGSAEQDAAAARGDGDSGGGDGSGGRAGWGAAVQALQHWLTDAQRSLGSSEQADATARAGSRRQRSKIWVSGAMQQ